MRQASTLREASERIDYGLTLSATVEPIGPRFLRITDIDSTHVDWKSVPYCAASVDESKKYALSTGDIVVARTGASTGRSQWVEVDEVAVFASYLVRFRINSHFDPRYVSYILQSHSWHEHVSSVAHGKSAQPNMSAREMADFEFEHPALSEQRAIAEVLGALDDKIAANTKLAGAASALAQVLYDHGVGGVDMQPMSAVLTPVLGGTPTRANPDFWGGDEWWASAKDVTGADNSVIISTEETISAAAVAQTKAKPLPVDSVIVTARGTVGAVARLAVPASFNQSCYGFTPDQAPAAILYFGIVNAMQRAKAIAHGSVFDTITMKTFDHLEFPAFADGVGEELDGKLGPLLDTVVARVKENRTLAGLRDTLLPELMSGRLRVKDAEKKIEEVV